MTSAPNVGDVYSVSLAGGGLVRLELIVKSAEFPMLGLVMPAAVALRLGKALLANAEHAILLDAEARQGVGGVYTG